MLRNPLHHETVGSNTSPMGSLKHSVSERNNNFPKNLSYVVQQVRHNCIIRYNKVEFQRVVKAEQIEQLKLSRLNTYKGEISKHTKTVINNRIHNWYFAIQNYNSRIKNDRKKRQKQLVFITLTLCANQFHSDKKIKAQMLKPFIRILREKYDVVHWFWKAESQANGRIHFHLLIDQFIDKKIIDEIWLKQLAKLGYLEEFNKKYPGLKPPSTNIKGVKDCGHVPAYMSKYVSKTDTGRKIEGAVWKMSEKLISLKSFELEEDSNSFNKLALLEELGEIHIEPFDNGEIIKCKSGRILDVLTSFQFDQWNYYYDFMVDYLYFDFECNDFSKYVRDFRFKINRGRFKDLFIQREEYPKPVQLDLYKSVHLFNQKRTLSYESRV